MRVRDKPFWMSLLNPGAVVAFFGSVYFPRGMRERLEREEPARFADILDHEMIHIARQHARGMLRWHVAYAFSRGFRWSEEMAAYHSTLRRLRSRGEDLGAGDRDALARRLAGPGYLFMTSRRTARAFIDQTLARP